jgi:hypothetical protein
VRRFNSLCKTKLLLHIRAQNKADGTDERTFSHWWNEFEVCAGRSSAMKLPRVPAAEPNTCFPVSSSSILCSIHRCSLQLGVTHFRVAKTGTDKFAAIKKCETHTSALIRPILHLFPVAKGRNHSFIFHAIRPHTTRTRFPPPHNRGACLTLLSRKP